MNTPLLKDLDPASSSRRSPIRSASVMAAREVAVLLAAYERAVAIAKARLDESTFAAAWAEGRAMTLEQAIAYALAESGTDVVGYTS